MSTKFMNILGLILLLGSLAYQWTGKEYEISKSALKETQLNADEKLILSNKYGRIDIKTWDKQEVKIDVLITVKAQNEKKAKEILDRVNIDFSEGNGFVKAETVFGEESNSWGWNVSYNVSYEINYTVFMPQNASLDISNKYGDSALPSLERDIIANIKYGSINFGDNSKNVKLELGYGHAYLKNLDNLDCDIKYSEMEILNALNAKIESKYSHHTFGEIKSLMLQSGYDDYRIEKVGKINNEGKYDDFRIGSAGEANFDTKYTDVSIKELHNSGKFYLRYGEIQIDQVYQSVTSMDFDVEYTDVYMKNNTGCSFDLNGSYTDFSFPENTQFSLKDNDRYDHSYKGKFGNGSTKLKASMRYGHMKIRS